MTIEQEKKEIIKELKKEIRLQKKKLKILTNTIAVPDTMKYSLGYATGICQGTMLTCEGFIRTLESLNNKSIKT